MALGDGRRPQRVAEQLRGVLGQALTAELADPRLSSVVITRVEIGPDLGIAWVFIRLLVGDDSERYRKRAVSALQGASGRLRRGVAPKLGLKRVPEIRFKYDTGPDRRARVDDLLHEVGLSKKSAEDVTDSKDTEIVLDAVGAQAEQEQNSPDE